MKVLVTGAAGFIGSHVCEALIEERNEITGLDNFNSFYSETIKRKNIEFVRATSKEYGSEFDMLEGDICDEGFMRQVFSSHNFDAVIHLAACAGVRPSIDDPELYARTNINGTVNLMKCMAESGVARLVFASSSSVYGNNENAPFRECDPVDRAISPYAASKKAAEVFCHVYHHLYGMSVACLRFFTVFGPRQRPDLAIHKFTRLIDSGQPIPFYGDGTARRDHTYIGDIVDGVVRALNWTDSPSPTYDIFNLGNNASISLDELVEAISRALGKPAILDRQPMQLGDVNLTCADIEHSRKVLGYSPKTSLAQGLEIFVDWYRKNK